MKTSLTAAMTIAALGIPLIASAQGLQVGAAKVDVTPAETELTGLYQGILDHIYTRAIVIGNGSTAAALVTVDAGGIPDPLWRQVSSQVESELGIPARRIC